MILYTPLCLQQVLEGWDEPRQPTMEIQIGAMIMEVEPLNTRQAKIVRLISPNAEDYLNPAYMPGTVIEWNVGL